MARKIILFAFIIAMCIFSQDLDIDVSIPYSSGIIDINPFRNHNETFFIRFSNRTVLSVNSLNGYFIMSDAYYGALAIESPPYNPNSDMAYYKKDDEMEKHYDYWGGTSHPLPDWLYSISLNSSDTVWDSALAFPDSLVPFDSIARVADDTVEYLQGKCFALDHQDEFDPLQWFEIMLEDYNTIFYVRGQQNINFKFQVYDYKEEKLGTGPDLHPSDDLVYVNLRWAIDANGNRKFKKDSTSIRNEKYSYSAVNAFPAKIIIRRGIVTLSKSGLNREMFCKIFDLKGKVLFNKTIRNSISISLITGVYMLQVTTGNKTYFKTISLLH